MKTLSNKTLSNVSLHGLVATPPAGQASPDPEQHRALAVHGSLREPPERGAAVPALLTVALFAIALTGITLVYASLPTSRAAGHADSTEIPARSKSAHPATRRATRAPLRDQAAEKHPSSEGGQAPW